MNRDKVLELAQQAELVRQLALEVPFVVDRLERFAALVEREVRGGMSRDKVFELMLTAGCSKYCDPKHPELEGFIVNDSVLDRIVALIEREVRGDAEPVAWLIKQETPTEDCLVRHPRVSAIVGDYNRAEAHCDIGKPIPLYTHTAPDVDAEPTLYQRRMKHLFDYRFQWSAWEECSKEVFNQHERQQIWGDYVYEARKLYLHPAPDVVRQLVDGLAGLIDFIEIDNLKIDQDAFRIARVALAAAKENGL